MGEEKRYRLLKDTPSDSAGAIFYKNGERYYEINGNIGKGNSYKSKYVEKNPEWFELIEDVERDTDELIAIQFILKGKPYRWCQTKESWAKYIDSIIKYERLYSKKELLEAEERGFNAARENSGYGIPGSLFPQYKTFSDYKNSTK